MKHLTIHLIFLLASISYLDVARAQSAPGASSPTNPDKPANRASDEEARPRGRLGFKLGASRSEFVGKDVTSDFAEYSAKLYWTAGLSASLRLYGALSFQVDFLFVSKGRETEVDGELFSTLHVDYFEIPLLLRLDPDWEPVSPYVLAGAALGVLWKFENKVESDGSVTSLKEQAEPLDWSGVVGLGLHSHGFSLEGRLDQGLATFLKEEVNQDAKHRVYAVMLGYQYSFPSVSPPPPDSDRDGVPDKVDGCINEPEDRDMFEDENGCPDLDNDDDGFLDEVDKCANEPEGPKDGFEDQDGCADPDNDGDGVLDEADKCQGELEDPDGFKDTDGCLDADNDDDGVLDQADKCDDKPEDRDSFEDEDGCPDPDNDGDGLADKDDSCQLEPEDKNGNQDKDGCPDEDTDQDKIVDFRDHCPNESGQRRYTGCTFVKLSAAGDKVEFVEQPTFRSNGSLRQDSPPLDELADLLNKKTEIRLRITGYAKNQANASKCAKSVMERLVKGGVAPGRLEAADAVSKKKVCSIGLTIISEQSPE